MLSAADLAAMQDVVTASLDQACQVQRNTPLADGYGHNAANWVNVGAATVCNIAQPSASLMQNYDYLIGDLATWLCRLPIGADIKRGDRLIVGGQTLNVQVELQPRSYQLAVRVLASEIK